MPVRRTAGERCSQAWISLTIFVVPLVGVALFCVLAVSWSLVSVWVGIPLVLWSTPTVRAYADHHRRLVERLTGITVADPYRPVPADVSIYTRFLLLAKDPATWRDFVWLLWHGTAGLLVGCLPAALLAEAFQVIAIQPLVFSLWDPSGWSNQVLWITVDDPDSAWSAVPLGFLALVLFWVGTPRLLRAYAHTTRLLLEPVPGAQLKKRVEHLTVSRSESVDSAAAELRRIERDLHDGAQARIVSLAMSLGLAQELMESDPRTASQLLEEARDSSTLALAELRQLVRGIHPPVLADRGLSGGLQALAMACPIPVESRIELPGRAPDPIEAALYFAAAEVLTNAARHSGADQIWLTARHADDRTTVVIKDDGIGGATQTAAGGLAGIRKRLDAFDGTVELDSPQGGPTEVTMEVTCALS